MKKNTNSRKISLIKNNLWKKQLRRKARIISGNRNLADNSQEYLEEINLLFPHLNNADKSISVNLSDSEKKIFTVTVGQGLYETDILEELKKYKDVPMKGFRQISKKAVKKNPYNQHVERKLGSLTLMDFRYGPQIRESLVYTKYFHEAKNQAIEQHKDFKDLIVAPFNLKKEKVCTFNIIFYDNKSQVEDTIQDFMKTNMFTQKTEGSNDQPSSSQEKNQEELKNPQD